ncbi:hypothetical protein JKF63_04009 [Porcisia hertigi]|uniref:Uncharacterized protein n=1 Tax=Porcisia hertigi TaxID=2761500 RepID=A0A836IM37_9TRYP|nr:hypothetical protein JKF63_04009 [Porcisia hertigi]
MSDCDGSPEAILQCSSSSSFNSELAVTDGEGRTDVRAFAVVRVSSQSSQVGEGSATHSRNLQQVDTSPLLLRDEADPIDVMSPLPALSSLMQSSSWQGSDSRARDSTTAILDSGCYSFSAMRDSASPPTTSTYFGDAAAAGSRVTHPEMSRMLEVNSLEDIRTPRSGAANSAVAEKISRSISRSPSVDPSYTWEAEAAGISIPDEFVAVNAGKARAAHELLTSFSAATMAQYRLVKLKVVQRIYRIYYNKWILRIFQRTAVVPPLRFSRDVQAQAPSSLSFHAETDFADIESFHASRSRSRAEDSRRTPVAATVERQHPQLFFSSAAALSPSPWRGEGNSDRETSSNRSPSPVSGAQTFAPASWSTSSPPSTYRVRTTFSPPSIPPTDGIAVRTRPAKLLDFGRRSDAPHRKKQPSVSCPVVKLPAVVLFPLRIFQV